MRNFFLLLPLASLAALAQTPTFEVASIKPAADPGRVPIFCIVPCTPGEQFAVDHGRVNARYISLKNLILRAYSIKGYQLSGPDAMSARFDIQAKMPDGASPQQLPEMLQAMLVERFRLSFHRAEKDVSVYAIVVGKNGAKLEPAVEAKGPPPEAPGSQPLYTPDGEARMIPNSGAEIISGPYGPVRISPPGASSPHIELSAITMSAFAEVIAPHKDRPVVDMTQLIGRYHIVIALDLPAPRGDAGGGDGGRKSGPPDGPGPAPADPFSDGLNTALNKAGLILEKRTAPVQTIVVDHVEKQPTAN